MTDVVQRAMDYRQELLTDISRIDDFLRIGAHLLRANRSAGEARETSEPRETVAVSNPEAPSRSETAMTTNALTAAFARASAPESEVAAQPQPAATPEAAPRRSLAFRGACEDSESSLRRNIA